MRISAKLVKRKIRIWKEKGTFGEGQLPLLIG